MWMVAAIYRRTYSPSRLTEYTFGRKKMQLSTNNQLYLENGKDRHKVSTKSE